MNARKQVPALFVTTSFEEMKACVCARAWDALGYYGQFYSFYFFSLSTILIYS